MVGKDYNYHSWNIQYSIFHKIFQRINGRKDNHSFIGSAKIHEYTGDNCTTYGGVYNRSSSYQEVFDLNTRTLHETSHNGCFQDSGHKWIRSNNYYIVYYIQSD